MAIGQYTFIVAQYFNKKKNLQNNRKEKNNPISQRERRKAIFLKQLGR